MKPREQKPLPRKTFRNFIKVLAKGNFIEILKILRRRFLNALKFAKAVFFRVYGIYYHHPIVEKRRQKRRLKHTLYRYFSWDETKNQSQAILVALIVRDGDTYPKSSAFIRLISPLTDKILKDKIALRLYPENTTAIDKSAAICIVQRNAIDAPAKAKELVTNLRASGAQLVLDSDDAFHSIDAEHPEHDEHRATLVAFSYLATEADQLWLSTPGLAASFNKINPSSAVVRNSLDPRLWSSDKVNSRRLQGKPIQMLYMGTVSHNADFEMIFPALDKVAAEYPGSFNLTVIGVSSSLPDRPWLERVYQKRGVSIYPRFVRWFLKQGPFDVGLSPLVNSEFNLGKSDIKCLDYLAAGALPVVSDIEPYRSAELDKYLVRVENTVRAWEKAIGDIVSDPSGFRAKSAKIVPEAQSYIWRERSSSATANQLHKLLVELKNS